MTATSQISTWITSTPVFFSLLRFFNPNYYRLQIVKSLSRSTMSNVPLFPTVRKLVLSYADASQVVRDCLQGTLCHVPRGPYRHEWQGTAQEQNVFVYEESCSGLRVWNDHIRWTRIYTAPDLVIEAFPTPPPSSLPASLSLGLMRISFDIACRGCKHSVVSYQCVDYLSRGLLLAQSYCPRPTILKSLTEPTLSQATYQKYDK
jgi:hypothetical protein